MTQSSIRLRLVIKICLSEEPRIDEPLARVEFEEPALIAALLRNEDLDDVLMAALQVPTVAFTVAGEPAIASWQETVHLRELLVRCESTHHECSRRVAAVARVNAAHAS